MRVEVATTGAEARAAGEAGARAATREAVGVAAGGIRPREAVVRRGREGGAPEAEVGVRRLPRRRLHREPRLSALMEAVRVFHSHSQLWCGTR